MLLGPVQPRQRSGLDPRAFWALEVRRGLFFIISCIVSVRKKVQIYGVWMQNSPIRNSAHIWKARLTQGNNVTVFVTHVLGELATQGNLCFYLRALHLAPIKSCSPAEPQSGDPRRVTVWQQSKHSGLGSNWEHTPVAGRSPAHTAMFG